MSPDPANAQYVKPALWGAVIVIILAIAAWYALTSNPESSAPMPTPIPELQTDLQQLDETDLDSIDAQIDANIDDSLQF